MPAGHRHYQIAVRHGVHWIDRSRAIRFQLPQLREFGRFHFGERSVGGHHHQSSCSPPREPGGMRISHDNSASSGRALSGRNSIEVRCLARSRDDFADAPDRAHRRSRSLPPSPIPAGCRRCGPLERHCPRPHARLHGVLHPQDLANGRTGAPRAHRALNHRLIASRAQPPDSAISMRVGRHAFLSPKPRS